MQSRPAGLVVLLLAILLATPAIPVGGAAGPSPMPRPGTTVRLSVASDGTEGNDMSYFAVVSADGGTVAFSSRASNLVPGDTNGAEDVFVLTRAAALVQRASVSTSGAQANGLSGGRLSISADGRFLAFTSEASNLVPGDTNGRTDVFVRDLAAGTTERVSLTSAGGQSSAGSSVPSISADGRFVVFDTTAALVPEDTNLNFDVYERDRLLGTTRLVSTNNEGTVGDDDSSYPTISADGRFVAFDSWTTNLIEGSDVKGVDIADVFVRDMVTGTIDRASAATDGTQADDDSRFGALSADGRFVAFWSWAKNLVPDDGNAATTEDVFVRDRLAGTTERVSVDSAGAQGSGASSLAAPAISLDGRFVAFATSVAGLVAGDSNGLFDVFVRDTLLRTTERVSVSTAGGEGDGATYSVPSISGDGRFVAFGSLATNLVPADTNGAYDVFLHDRGPDAGVATLVAPPTSSRSFDVSGRSALTGAVLSAATDATGDVPRGSELGTDLTRTSLSYRHWDGTILVVLGLASMPGAVAPGGPGVVGAAGIVYGLAFRANGVPFEARAWRGAAGPQFVLDRCEPACVAVASLSGGIGTAGLDARLSIPTELLGPSGDVRLTSITAFTTADDAGLDRFDEVELPDATLDPRVEVALAPQGGSPPAPSDWTRARLDGASFTATISPVGQSAGAYDVLARVCLAQTCELARSPIELTNRAPAVAPLPSPTVDEGVLLALEVSASDPDGDALVLSAQSLPSGASFVDHSNGSGTLFWTPAYDQAGTFDVEIRATDGLLGTAASTTITVANADRLPQFSPVTAPVVTEGTTTSVKLSAVDPDGDVVAITIASGPVWASIVDEGNGNATLALAPPVGSLGPHTVTLQATSTSAATSTTLGVTVLPSGGVSLSRVTAAPIQTSPGSVTMSAIVTNTGPNADTFALQVTTTNGWAHSIPSPVTLASGASQTLSWNVTVPSAGGASFVALRATSQLNANATTSLGWGVSTPVTIVTTFSKPAFTPLVDNVTGTVRVTFLDGSPAVHEALQLAQKDPVTGLTSTARGWTDATGTLAFDYGGANGAELLSRTPGVHSVTVLLVTGPGAQRSASYQVG